MYLIVYEDYGKDPRNIATAETLAAAKACIANEFDGTPPKDSDYHTDEIGRIVFSLGDTDYIIQALPHWSKGGFNQGKTVAQNPGDDFIDKHYPGLIGGEDDDEATN